MYEQEREIEHAEAMQILAFALALSMVGLMAALMFLVIRSLWRFLL